MAESKSEAKDPKDAKAPAGGDKPTAKKRNPKLLIIIAAAAAVLLLGGGAAALFLLRPASEGDAAAAQGGEKGKDGKDEGGKKKAEAKKPSFVDLEMFTVNLKDPEKFLQIKLTFRVKSAEASEGMKELMPVVRSAVIPVLSSQDPADLATPEGKAKLCSDVAAAANNALAGGELADSVEAALITHMIIQ